MVDIYQLVIFPSHDYSFLEIEACLRFNAFFHFHISIAPQTGHSPQVHHYSKLIKYSGSKNMAYILKDLSANAFLKTSIVCFNIHWNSKPFWVLWRRMLTNGEKILVLIKAIRQNVKTKSIFPHFFFFSLRNHKAFCTCPKRH